MKCECAICALKIDFDLPSHLLEEIEAGRAVIFAGAGISTETSGAHLNSFYQELENAVDGESGLSFCELVDHIENRPNGRQSLIDLIRFRFDYIDSWRDLREAAIRFHKSLSTAPYFQTIITTNWDRYFEDVMRATPFVYDSDLAFWENANRPLLKIHGSIDNLSTIVASSADYRECEERLTRGRLGDVLRLIFATKTVIFVGYSATDSDFLNIYENVRGSMGKFARRHYLVSPFVGPERAETLLKELNIHAMCTDATHFVEVVKTHMQEKFCFAYDQAYDGIFEALAEISAEHFAFTKSYSVFEEPHLIFATAYQDGLIHCFQRILDRRYTNDFADLHRVRGMIDLYSERIRHYTKARDYWNESYFIGYQMGLIYFDILNGMRDEKQDVPEELTKLPHFYHPKVGLMNRKEYAGAVRQNPDVHKSALKQARRIARDYEGADELVVQHPPFG